MPHLKGTVLVLLLTVMVLAPLMPDQAKSGDLEYSGLEMETPADSMGNLSLNEAIALGNGLSLTVNRYETSGRFQYYPAGGYLSSTLSAKDGYHLLCVYVRVENKGDGEVSVSRLLNAGVYCGAEYTAKAKDSLYYLTKQGVYAGGLKVISPRSAVEGCLLFSLPDRDVISDGRYILQMNFNDRVYEWALRGE